MSDSTGQSAPDHEGTNLEPDERDDEVLTMTRRQLRILVNGILDVVAPWDDQEAEVERQLDEKLKDHVRLDTITPKELAR